MRISEAFPTKYVSAPDLQGKDINLTINHVAMESVGSPSENLPVIYFMGTQKGLVLNKTNGQTIAEQHGDESDQWQGKKITLYPTSTDYAGRTVPCIRVRTAMAGGSDIARQDPLVQQNQGQTDPLGDQHSGGGYADLNDQVPFLPAR